MPNFCNARSTRIKRNMRRPFYPISKVFPSLSLPYGRHLLARSFAPLGVHAARGDQIFGENLRVTKRQQSVETGSGVMAVMAAKKRLKEAQFQQLAREEGFHNSLTWRVNVSKTCARAAGAADGLLVVSTKRPNERNVLSAFYCMVMALFTTAVKGPPRCAVWS